MKTLNFAKNILQETPGNNELGDRIKSAISTQTFPGATPLRNRSFSGFTHVHVSTVNFSGN